MLPSQTALVVTREEIRWFAFVTDCITHENHRRIHPVVTKTCYTLQVMLDSIFHILWWRAVPGGWSLARPHWLQADRSESPPTADLFWAGLILMYLASGAHVTEGLWTHNPNLVKIHVAFIWKIMIRPDLHKSWQLNCRTLTHVWFSLMGSLE